jgi:uncharacterized protein (DUF58 family)
VLVAGVTLLTVGLVAGSVELVGLSALALIPLVAGPLVVRRRVGDAGGLTIRTEAVPRVVATGEWVDVTLSATNDGPHVSPALGVVPPGIRTSGAGLARLCAPAATSLVSVASAQPRSVVVVSIRRRMARRGRYEVGASRIWVYDPFSLYAVSLGSTRPATVLVHPVAVPLDRGAPRQHGTDRAGAHVLAGAAGNEVGGELAGLRPYVPGDRLHLLHWPTVQRGREPFVKEFSAEQPGSVLVVIDDRAGYHRRRTFDVMLGMTLTVLDEAAEKGLTVELATLSGEALVVPPDITGRYRALALLASAQPRRGAVVRAPTRPCTVMTTATAAASLPPFVRALASVEVAPAS